MYYCMRLEYCVPMDETQFEEVEPVPNIKSAKKRVELAKVANEANKQEKSILKTAIKKFEAAVEAGNKEQADSAYQTAVKTIDKAAAKGILHKNTAARKKSSIARKMNGIA